MQEKTSGAKLDTSHCHKPRRHKAVSLSSALRKQRPVTAGLRRSASQSQAEKIELAYRIKEARGGRGFDLRQALDEGNAQALIDEIVDENYDDEYGLVDQAGDGDVAIVNDYERDYEQTIG